MVLDTDAYCYRVLKDSEWITGFFFIFFSKGKRGLPYSIHYFLVNELWRTYSL